MKKHKPKNLGVIVLFIILTFSTCFIVNAKTATKKTETKKEETTDKEVEKKICSSESTLLKKYNVKFDKTGNTYSLSINPDATELKNVVFKVVKIGKQSVTDKNLTVKKGSPLKDITINESDYETSGREKKAEITITTNDDPDCDIVRISASITSEGDEVSNQQDSDFEIEEGDLTVKNPIDCNSPNGAFDEAFCLAKKNAKSLSQGQDVLLKNTTYARKDKSKSFHYQDLGTRVIQWGVDSDESKVSGTGKLTCDYKVLDKSQLQGDNYYQNKSYYYAENETIIDYGNYEYHYAPGLEVHKEGDIKCKVKCEEAIEVEYGPPVASKAGLCFEYKVKVTSRVSCNMIEKPSKPKKKTGYCTPSPTCTGTNSSGNSYVVTEGGPNEEFDQCIKDCDGGKYSEKCSKKCYSEVYGNTTQNKQLALNSSATIKRMNNSTTDKELEDCKKLNSDGCYYYSGGSIAWSGSGVGRWYRLYGWKDYSEYKNVNGFYRHDYGDGNMCSDTCWWSGCSGKYLNPGTAEKDNEENLKKYKDAIKKCKSAATCSTKTAEFTISTKYKDKSSKTIKEIKFPYNKAPDKISSKEAESKVNTASCYKEGNKSLSSSCMTSVLDYDGCYFSGSSNDKYYMTEWSFPGTWIHNKTGEISYKYPSPNKGWYTAKEKFCIPLTAGSVNTKWWEWYKISKQPNDQTRINDILTTELNKSYENVSNYSNPNGYNIKALAEKFGYFGWNFDIQCFYALRNEECVKGDDNRCQNDEKLDCPNGDCSKCTGDKCDPNPEKDYVTRPVDKNKVFPNTGDSLTPDNSQKREIPFNWTSKATIPSSKNSSYSVNPEELLNALQNPSENIFDGDKYLDYHFELTPVVLNQLRRYNAQYKYGTWNGETIRKGGINVYQSNLFRASVGTDHILLSSTRKCSDVGINNANRTNLGG